MAPDRKPARLSRRAVVSAPALLAVVLLRRPAGAAPALMEAAIRDFTGHAPVSPGKVRLEIPPLVENGNTVPVTITVESPMAPDRHVRAIALFNGGNPQPNVITARLGSRSGRAVLSTRMRLATSQRVVAVAEMSDGTFWSDSAEVVVTLAACVES
ncbi:SoxY-related AACIE arm protein [Roseomonas xinghualingensis]|uniref:SoxY-related AACIE arm protein n=1 Tax=Roseomonas xinghualingensis TaxID=2986475 RepID=UPI0021F22DAF|nr:SoxY-related AACIE arm protein [Roseomonas sp. SXEYE001]MCV4209723.1 SoxY-related AACIE arm protein [Roseomonas sp. SXEYE001]